MGSFLCSLSEIVEGDNSLLETKKDTRPGVFSFLASQIGKDIIIHKNQIFTE